MWCGVFFGQLTGQRRASRGVGGWVSRLLSRSSLVTVVDCCVASSVVLTSIWGKVVEDSGKKQKKRNVGSIYAE